MEEATNIHSDESVEDSVYLASVQKICANLLQQEDIVTEKGLVILNWYVEERVKSHIRD